MKTNRFIALSLFALVCMATFVGCRKKQDTIVEITVLNAANQAVAGAKVTLIGMSTTTTSTNNPNEALPPPSTTNTSGVATFNFNEVYQLGQAGVTVMNIDVQKDALTGQGIIKVEQEVTSEETVFVQ